MPLDFFSPFQWILLLGSIYLFGVFAWTIIRIELSRSWPTTPGKIIESEIKTGFESSGNNDYTWMHKPSVKYQYQVNLQVFTGDNVWFSQISTSWKSGASKRLEEYPVGTAVEVIYNPIFPSDSLLPSARPSGYWHCLLILIPIAGVVIALKL